MRTHKKNIYIFSFIGGCFFLLGIILEFNMLDRYINTALISMPWISGHRGFAINMILAICCSALFTILMEVINYQVSKREHIIKFINDSLKLVEKYKIIRYQLRNDRDDIDKLKNIYCDILYMDLTELDACRREISFFRNKNIELLINKIFYSILELQQIVRKHEEALEAYDNEMIIKGIINDLNSKFEYEKNLGEGRWKICYVDREIFNEIRSLENLYFKTEWYRSCVKTIWWPCFLRGITYTTIKWSKEIKENYYSFGNEVGYKKIPFVNYKIKMTLPIGYSKQEFEEMIKNFEQCREEDMKEEIKEDVSYSRLIEELINGYYGKWIGKFLGCFFDVEVMSEGQVISDLERKINEKQLEEWQLEELKDILDDKIDKTSMGTIFTTGSMLICIITLMITMVSYIDVKEYTILPEAVNAYFVVTILVTVWLMRDIVKHDKYIRLRIALNRCLK